MIVTLTDFGTSEYLGVMKGVIYSIVDKATITDLCNDVSPHGIREAAWLLYNSYSYFPQKSVFLCVVDPGVGTERKGIVIKTKNYYFVGPDNGLMYPAAEDDGIVAVYEIPQEDKDSVTFDGRDVFAPTAALVSKGRIKGTKTEEYVRISILPLERVGEVMRIDRFGNVITNIEPTGDRFYSVEINGRLLEMSWFETYGKAGDTDIFLVTGSSGTLEISMKEKPASHVLGAHVGQRIVIEGMKE